MNPGRTLLAVSILLASLPASAARTPKAVYQDQQYRIRPDRKDQVPPSVPKVELGGVTRGRGPQVSDDGTRLVVSRTDGNASVELVVSAEDDRTPEAELGYEVNLFDVYGIEGSMAPPFPLAARDGRIVLRWEESARDEQKPVTFLVSVRSVDRAGNKSKPTPSQPIVVPGRRVAEIENEGRQLGPLAAAACGTEGAGDPVVQVPPSRFVPSGPIKPDATWILLDAETGERRSDGDPVAAFVLPPRLDTMEMQLRVRCASGDELVRWIQLRDDGRFGLATSSELADPTVASYQPAAAPVEYLPEPPAEP